LTLCQLDIAKFEIPQECKNIDKYDHSRECVVALGRINQFWTTYNGFYHESGLYNEYTVYDCKIL